jgi:hypothetical protein
LAVLCVSACNGQTTNTAANGEALGAKNFPFIDEHNLDFGNVHGAVSLSVEKQSIRAGEALSMRVRFVNTGKAWDFYNPFFVSRIPLPGQITLYDSNHNYICEIAPWTSSSVIGMSWDNWTYLPGRDCVIEFPMQLKPAFFRKPLQPGDYYLQIIYYKAFIALDPPWSETNPDVEAKQARLKEFEAHFDRSELFRSNPVKITITE